jgi:hypothetical protein
MRSKELNLDCYNTDKITHRYLDVYDPILAPWVGKKIRLLEVGIHKGGSLQLWRDYFRLGVIIGIDIKLPEHFVPGERIQIFKGSQADKQFLSEVANKTATEGFDIIIDDASHLGALTKTAFCNPMPMQTKNTLPRTASIFPTNDLEAFTIKSSPTGSIAADPNPFRAHSQGLGRTTVSWMTYATSEVEVHVDAPDGPVFVRSGPGSFSHKTAQWARDGTTFYLQNVSGGLPLTSPEHDSQRSHSDPFDHGMSGFFNLLLRSFLANESG